MAIDDTCMQISAGVTIQKCVPTRETAFLREKICPYKRKCVPKRENVSVGRACDLLRMIELS